MIRCLPRGIFSWTFDLDGEGHRAAAEFDWIGEEGTIVADGVRFQVRKHGLFSGRWTLERDGEAVASARKSSAFTRTFEVESPAGPLLLRAESAFGRRFRADGVATIAPDHAFTRRARIETVRRKSDFPTICFLFWLAVLTWRRRARNSSPGSN